MCTRPAAGLAAAVCNVRATQTDMHVQHSEQTARDQLVIGRLQADAAQVTPVVGTMPEPAVVSSTTHDAAPPAQQSCPGVGAAQGASAQTATGSSRQLTDTATGQSHPGLDSVEIGMAADSLAQRRSELLLEQQRGRRACEEQSSSTAGNTPAASGWNGAAAPEQLDRWNGATQTVGPTGSEPTEPMAVDSDPDCEQWQRQDVPVATNSGLGLERDPATLRVKLRLAMPNGTELSDIDVLVDTGSEPDLVDSNFAQLLWRNGVRYGDGGGHLTVVGGGTIQPQGSMRVTVVVAGRDGAKQSFALPVPRRLEFEVEPQIIDNCPAQLVLGWATLKGTGLIDVLFGTDQFEPES